MIIWLASYPNSGNDFLRSLLSSYIFSKDGSFNEDVTQNIDEFPNNSLFKKLGVDINNLDEMNKNYINSQKILNKKDSIMFLKTHSCFVNTNKFKFTDRHNTLGVIYIVRDPRNIITSIKNHYDLDDDKAIKWMTNKNNYIYDVEKVKEVGYGDFQFISSWDLNYKSWKVQKKIPIKFIKYEDLTKQTYSVVLEIIEFIYKITNNYNKIDKNKLKNALNSTTFEKLQHKEKIQGFSEAVSSLTTNEKITFFNLGPKNDWKKILNEDLKNRINQIFEKNLKELSYV